MTILGDFRQDLAQEDFINNWYLICYKTEPCQVRVKYTFGTNPRSWTTAWRWRRAGGEPQKLLPGALERSRASSEFWSGDTDIRTREWTRNESKELDKEQIKELDKECAIIRRKTQSMLTCPTFGVSYIASGYRTWHGRISQLNNYQIDKKFHCARSRAKWRFLAIFDRTWHKKIL